MAVSSPVSLEASAGDALVASPSLRRALRALLKLKRSEGGEAHLAALAERATDQLYSGETDWPSLLGGAATWEAAGVPIAEAEEVLRGAAQLIAISSKFGVEVKITARNGLSYEGTVAGETVSFSLQVVNPAVWGQYSAFAVTEGTPELHGRRMTSVQRTQMPTELGMALAPNIGDIAFFAEPDRAAVLESIAWEVLPDKMYAMEPTLKERRKNGEEVTLAPQMQQALEFANSIQNLDPDVQNRRVLERLLAWPPLAGMAAAAEADAEWAEFFRTLRPQSLVFYGAMRRAVLRTMSSPEMQEKYKNKQDPATQVEVRISLFQIIGAILAAAALAFVAATALKEKPTEDVPLYTLNSGTTNTRVVPLSSRLLPKT